MSTPLRKLRGQTYGISTGSPYSEGTFRLVWECLLLLAQLRVLLCSTTPGCGHTVRAVIGRRDQDESAGIRKIDVPVSRDGGEPVAGACSWLKRESADHPLRASV